MALHMLYHVVLGQLVGTARAFFYDLNIACMTFKTNKRSVTYPLNYLLMDQSANLVLNLKFEFPNFSACHFTQLG